MAEFDANTQSSSVFSADGIPNGGYWDASGSFSGASADSDPPTIENMVPADGSIPSGSFVEFDVLDSAPGVSRVFLFLQYSSGDDVLVVHDGIEFKARFSDSTRAPIANGYHYRIRPSAGWLSGFTLSVHAFDLDGNIA